MSQLGSEMLTLRRRTGQSAPSSFHAVLLFAQRPSFGDLSESCKSGR